MNETQNARPDAEKAGQSGAQEQNFVSAVLYVSDDAARVPAFLARCARLLSRRFAHWELVCVNDASADGSAAAVRAFSKENDVPVTLLNMSLRQGREKCMNAGVDMAIGDDVFEFDSLSAEFPDTLPEKAYETALTGYDIVSVCPVRNRTAGSGLFYRVFNAFSHSRYGLQTDAFRLLSRRAINRVRAVTPAPPYRKAAYAASGLAVCTLKDPGVRVDRGAAGPRLTLAVDSLALYTDAAYRFSFGVSVLMLAGTLAELIYTLAVYLSGAKPVEGWTTTMFVLTVGFFGVFAILTIVLKYLSLLVDLVFRRQKYLVESVEKLQ